MYSIVTFLLILLIPFGVVAKPALVVTSIPPIHSAVSFVMQGIGTPVLLIPASVAIHGHALKPSDMSVLSKANLVIWSGSELEPFLSKPLQSLKTKNIALLQNNTLALIENDPHFWLMPENMAQTALITANALAQQDPENAEIYYKNAHLYVDKMNELTKTVQKTLEPYKNKPFYVYHDAYQYFQKAFNISPIASITLDSHHGISPKRISLIREKIKGIGHVCVFIEPQQSQKTLAPFFEGLSISIHTLDPLGEKIKIGQDFYEKLIHTLAIGLKECLSTL